MEPNIDYEIKYVDNEEKLKHVLELCYSLLGLLKSLLAGRLWRIVK